MSSNILADRDTNVQQVSANMSENEKPKSMEYHRQVFESRLKDGQAHQNYISPSDSVLSPASQKLKDFKSRHGLKKSKPQTLFAKTSTKNLEAARDGPLFSDVTQSQKSTESNNE